MFSRQDDPIQQSTQVLVQVAGLLLFTAAVVVLVARLATEPDPSPFDTIRRAGAAVGFAFADVYLAVALVSGRPLTGRSPRLDARLLVAWSVLVLTVAVAVLAAAIALGDVPALAGSLLVLGVVPFWTRRAVGRLWVVPGPARIRSTR